MTCKQAYISLLVLVMAFTAFEELWLRRYLVRHHLHAFYLADSLPNLVAVVLFFLPWSVIKYPLGRKDSLVVAAQASSPAASRWHGWGMRSITRGGTMAHLTRRQTRSLLRRAQTH